MSTTAGLLQPLVSVLDVFSHRARISVALSAACVSTDVRLSRDVSLHVFGAVARVVEFLCAAFVVTLVWLFPGVRPYVQLEVLETGERSRARRVLAPVRLFSRVATEMRDEFVSRIERFFAPRTVLPETDVLVHGDRVSLVQVTNQQLEEGKLLIAVLPATDERTTLFHVFFGEVRGSGRDGREGGLEKEGGAPWVHENGLLKEGRLGSG